MTNEVPLIKAEKTPERDVKLDPNGFFVIELDKKKNLIRVEYYSNVYKENRIASGKLKKVFIGKKADALSDTISKHIKNLQPEHYMYLGRELQRAEDAIKNKKEFEQGGC